VGISYGRRGKASVKKPCKLFSPIIFLESYDGYGQEIEGTVQ